jgi:hypothetical protein
MAKRNAKKQATREEIESSDPVCRKLADLADEADLLLMTAGADYDNEGATGKAYEQRLAYLPVLIGELVDHRVALVVAEEMNPLTETDEEATPEEGPTAQEGTDAADDAETAE